MPEDLLGAVFSERYTIEEKIGAGGMATVYRARDERSAQDVAIKILSQAFLARNPKESERNLRRFKREAQILERLNGSDHVVGFVECDRSEQGDWYIAMELLRGEQLRHYIGRGRTVMGVPTFLHLGLGILEGLSEIHARNIIHRDLAPDNVIVSRDSEGILLPKYLDFGIGKSLGDELDQVTQMLTIMGKPQYFSPEQARGLDLTTASDVYSIGVVLYEMITGYVPLEVQGYPDFRKIQKEPPTAISSHREGCRVPSELQDLIMRCLEKRPEDRPLLEQLIAEVKRTQERFNSGEIWEGAGSGVITTERNVREDAGVQTTLHEFQPGDRIHNYEVKGLLGRGGMGAVYLAWDPILHRDVAIKVVNRVEEEKARKAVLREARASSALNSPSVVTIYEAGTEGGIPYIAMEYVKGRTLAEIIEEDGPLERERFWSVARGICEGLRVAHERERPVIHRDLKPSNLLVDRRDQVRVTDFGIAKVASTMSAQGGDTAAHGMGEGTVATMSPEQANGKPVDQRTDIYSLGCVLYMMATGRAPFRGNQISILYQHCTAPPEPPSKQNAAVRSWGIDRVILRCLEKEPADRYQTVRQLEDDLLPIFDDTVTGQTGPWHRSRATWAAAAALVVVVLVAGYALLRGNPGPPPAFKLTAVTVKDKEYLPGSRDCFFTNRARIGLRGNSLAPELPLRITITHQDGDGEPCTETIAVVTNSVGELQTFIKLDVGEDDVAPVSLREYQVAIAIDSEASEPLSAFDVFFDGSGPRIKVLPPGHADWILLVPDAPQRVYALRQEDVEFLIEDPETGLARRDGAEPASSVRGRVPDLEESGFLARFSPSERQGTRVGRYDIAARDLVENAANGTVEVVLVEFSVVPAENESRIITRDGTVEVAVLLAVAEHLRDGFPVLENLDGLTVEIEGTAVPLTPEGGGRYVARLALPGGDPAARREHALVFRHDGALVPSDIRVIQDEVAPQISVRICGDDGAERDHHSTDAASPPTLRIPQSELAGFQVHAGDLGGVGLAEPPSMGVRYGDGPEVTITPFNPESPGSSGEGYVFLLPPQAPGPRFRAALRVEDRAGNATTMDLAIELEESEISEVAFEGSIREGGTVFVRDASGLGIAVDASGLSPEDRLEARLANAAIAVLPLTLEGGVWKGRFAELALEKAVGQREVEIWAVRTEGDRERRLLGRYTFVVDTVLPEVTLRIGDRVGHPGEKLVLGHFPAVVFEIRDDFPLRTGRELQIEPVPANAPRPRMLVDQITGGYALRVEPPPRMDGGGAWILKLSTRDRAGNAVELAPLVIEVIPPEIALRTIDRQPVQPFQFDEAATPYVTRERRLELVFQNRRDGVSYEILGQSDPEGEPKLLGLLAGTMPMPFALDVAEEHGRVVFTYRELGAPDKLWPIDSLNYLIDTRAPVVSFLKDGAVVEEARLRSGLELGSLNQIRIVVQDDTSLPFRDCTRLEGEELPGLRLIMRSDDGTKVTYELEADASWQESKEISLVATDRAGNPTREYLLHLLKAENLPRIDSLKGPRGACVEVPGATTAVNLPEIQLHIINRTDGVNRVTAQIDDHPESDLDPFDGHRRFLSTLPLPVTAGDYQEFQLTLRCFRGTTAGEEFATRRVIYDVRPPRITLYVDGRGEPAAAEIIELDRIDRLLIRISDPSGVKPQSVRYLLSRSGTGSGTRLMPQRGEGNDYLLQPLREATNEVRDVAVFVEDRLGNALPEPFRFRIRLRIYELDPRYAAGLDRIVMAAATGTIAGLSAASAECDRLLEAVRSGREAARKAGVTISSEVDRFLQRAAPVSLFLRLRAQEPADQATARQRYVNLIGTAALPEPLRAVARARAEELQPAVVVAPPVRPVRPGEGRRSLAAYRSVVDQRIPGTGMELVPITPSPTAPGGQPLFFLGRTEVTVQQFWPFVQAWERDAESLIRQITDSRGEHNPHGIRWTRSDPDRLRKGMAAAIAQNRIALQEGKLKHPVCYISRYVAAAYASWLGGRLPMEKEWKNAAGHKLDLAAAWIVYHEPGHAPESDKRRLATERKWAVVGDNSRGRALPVDELEPYCLYGLAGMAGNVSEWVMKDSNKLSRAGTMGGSFRHRHDDPGGCQLDRKPYRESDSDFPAIRDVGFRVLWPME